MFKHITRPFLNRFWKFQSPNLHFDGSWKSFVKEILDYDFSYWLFWPFFFIFAISKHKIGHIWGPGWPIYSNWTIFGILGSSPIHWYPLFENSSHAKIHFGPKCQKRTKQKSIKKIFDFSKTFFFQSLALIERYNISKFQPKRLKNGQGMAIFVQKISEILKFQKKHHFTKLVLETKRLDQKSKYLGSEHVQGLGSGWA